MKKKIIFIFISIFILFIPNVYADKYSDLIQNEDIIYKDINEDINLLFIDWDNFIELRKYTLELTNGTISDATIRLNYEFINENDESFIIEINFNFKNNFILSTEICIDDDSYFVYERIDSQNYYFDNDWYFNFNDYFKEERIYHFNKIYTEVFIKSTYIFNENKWANKYLFFKGLYCHEDKINNKIELNYNNILSLNEIIKISGIFDNQYNNISKYKLLNETYDEENNIYYYEIMSFDINNNIINKNLEVHIVDELLYIHKITLSYNANINVKDLINNYNSNLDMNIKSLYFSNHKTLGSYDYYLYFYDNDYLYIDKNIIEVIDDIGPVIRFKDETLDDVIIIDKNLKNEEYFIDLFDIYDDISNVETEIIGYDDYCNHYDECGIYDLSVKAYDEIGNVNIYNFKLKILDDKYNEYDYYININLSNRKNIIDIKNYLISEGLINDNEEVTLESDYFEANEGGCFDLYVKRDNGVDVYKINLFDDLIKEDNKSNKNNNKLIIIIIIISFSTIGITSIIIWRRIYEKRH